MAISLTLMEALYLPNTFGQKDGTQVKSQSSVLFTRTLVNSEFQRLSCFLRNEQLIIVMQKIHFAFFFVCCVWISVEQDKHHVSYLVYSCGSGIQGQRTPGHNKSCVSWKALPRWTLRSHSR